MKKLLKHTKELGVLLGLLLLIVIFSSLSPYFLSVATFASIASVSTEMGILALGATLLMIAGEFDLSLGSNFALSAMIFAGLTATFGVSCWIALLASLGTGLLIGCINGFITLKTRIPSFITTLGTMLIIRGIVLVVTDGFPIAASETNSVMNLFASEIGGGFKISLLWWFGLFIYFYYLLNHHPFGNHLFATGGNDNAAFSMGVRTKVIKMQSFMITGVLAALAGVIQFAHLMSISPTAGEQYELKAIAIAVIGGTALTGGYGTMVGTFLATLVMGVLASGLVQAGVSTYWLRTLIGVILVSAVILNMRIQRAQNQV